MSVSWYEKVREFKSPLHVIAAVLLRSRETQLEKCSQLSQQVDELQAQVEQQTRQLRQKQEEIDRLTQRAVVAEQQRDQARQSVNVPEDPPIGTHGYGARMISLAVNLARSVGFRGAVRTLQVFFQWLGIDRALPSRTSIRNWLQRLGIDAMNQPLDSNESLVIMVDHSSQIGTEKVMLALGVNAAAMPERGKALTHGDVRVLKGENMLSARNMWLYHQDRRMEALEKVTMIIHPLTDAGGILEQGAGTAVPGVRQLADSLDGVKSGTKAGTGEAPEEVAVEEALDRFAPLQINCHKLTYDDQARYIHDFFEFFYLLNCVLS